MGYRANVITQEREYGGQTFSNWDEFVYKFIPAVEENDLDIHGNDAEDFFEVEKAQLQRYVDRLPDNEEVSAYPSCSNKELKMVLEEAIKEAPGEWVQWEWW